MTAMWRRPVCLVNTSVVDGESGAPSTLRFSSRVLSVGEPPKRNDVVVDLSGALVLPGLVNAHDHLELNHFGRLKFRACYENAAQWIDDMRPRLHEDPAIRQARAHSLSDRLHIGALKNVLSGVTTVRPLFFCHYVLLGRHHRLPSQPVLPRASKAISDPSREALRLGPLFFSRRRARRRSR